MKWSELEAARNHFNLECIEWKGERFRALTYTRHYTKLFPKGHSRFRKNTNKNWQQSTDGINLAIIGCVALRLSRRDYAYIEVIIHRMIIHL